MSDVREDGRGPLSAIQDPVAAKEIGKLWTTVESIRGGYRLNADNAAATKAELAAVEKALYQRIDASTKQAKTFVNGGQTIGGTGSVTQITGQDIRPLNNAWLGANEWKSKVSKSYALWSPEYATMQLYREDELPPYPFGGIVNDVGIVGNLFADTVYSGNNYNAILPMYMHGVSVGSHKGNAWGFATEVYNAQDKLGQQSPTQLFGAETAILNLVYDSTAARHAGLLVVFKNRLDFQNGPVHGKPPSGKSYNRNTSAVYIDSGAGRTNGLPGGDTSIECGWWRGIYFSPYSLDRSSGNSTQHNGKAIGIDMGDLDGNAPEGGHFYNRLHCAISLPPNTGITWDGSGRVVETRFNNQTGDFEFRVAGSKNVAINFSTGYYTAPGGTYLNLYAPGERLFSMLSYDKIDSTAFASLNFAGSLKILIDGLRFFIPIYSKS